MRWGLALVILAMVAFAFCVVAWRATIVGAQVAAMSAVAGLVVGTAASLLLMPLAERAGAWLADRESRRIDRELWLRRPR